MNLGNKLAIAFASVSIGILFVCLFVLKGQDKTAPVISFSQNDTVYTESMDMKELLKGVEAKDDVDGDVTEKIVIEKITKTSSGKSVIVTYAAGDNRNNFTKASRIFQARIHAADTKGDSKSTNPIEAGTGTGAEIPVIAETESSVENMEANENADQDTENNAEENQPEEQAEAEQEPAPDTEEPVNQSVPVLQLNATETVLKKGTFFNINDYIAQLSDDMDTTETLQHRIRTNGAFDNNVVGDYQVTVMVADSEGNISQPQNLVIHVVE